jgi:hypothetical protein
MMFCYIYVSMYVCMCVYTYVVCLYLCVYVCLIDELNIFYFLCCERYVVDTHTHTHTHTHSSDIRCVCVCVCVSAHVRTPVDGGDDVATFDTCEPSWRSRFHCVFVYASCGSIYIYVYIDV